MKKVLILGCGWVAEDLASKLLDNGFQVWATTTQEEKVLKLSAIGVQAVLADFDQGAEFDLIPKEFDYVLTSIPAASKLDISQVEIRFNNVLTFLKGLSFRKNIYLSSTGIYPDVDGLFTKEYSLSLNERLLVAEQLMLSLDKTIVYRLGGLFGKNRIFAKYFENRVCSTGNQLANFVHVDDVVELISQGFSSDLQSSIYNIVAPEHPKKEDVIRASALKYGFDLPTAFEPKDSFQKVVDGTKILRELSYTYKYTSPLDF